VAPSHPLALVLPALLADTAGHICGIGAVPEVAPTSGHQGSLERGRPRFICLGEPPHLIRCQGEVAQRQTEWFAVADRVEELLAYFDGQTCSRFRPCANTGNVAVRSPACGAATASVPPCPAPVRRFRDGAGLAELLKRPRRL
jgi:hypothetical protein